MAIAPERVIVTSSGMSAIMLTVQTLVGPGDNVVIVSPIWPNIVASVEALGGEARMVSLQPTSEGAWRLDLDRVLSACDERTRAIFVNSPSNPTGWTMSLAEGEAILDFARRRGSGSLPTTSTSGSSTTARSRRPFSRSPSPRTVSYR